MANGNTTYMPHPNEKTAAPCGVCSKPSDLTCGVCGDNGPPHGVCFAHTHKNNSCMFIGATFDVPSKVLHLKPVTAPCLVSINQVVADRARSRTNPSNKPKQQRSESRKRPLDKDASTSKPKPKKHKANSSVTASKPQQKKKSLPSIKLNPKSSQIASTPIRMSSLASLPGPGCQ